MAEGRERLRQNVVRGHHSHPLLCGEFRQSGAVHDAGPIQSRQPLCFVGATAACAAGYLAGHQDASPSERGVVLSHLLLVPRSDRGEIVVGWNLGSICVTGLSP